MSRQTIKLVDTYCRAVNWQNDARPGKKLPGKAAARLAGLVFLEKCNVYQKRAIGATNQAAPAAPWRPSAGQGCVDSTAPCSAPCLLHASPARL